MPEPREGESRADFVERCIPMVIDDGTAEDGEQAAAICNSMWEDAKKSMKELSFDTMERRARDAFYARFRPPSPPQSAVESDMWVKEVFEEKIVVEAGGTLWAYPYTVENGAYTWGEPYEVEQDYKPKKSLGDDTLVAFGGSVKALGNGRVGGYLVRFSNPDDLDLDGEYFNAATDYCIEDGAKTPVYLNHRQPLRTGKKGQTITVKKQIGEGTLSFADDGILIDAILYERGVYEKTLAALGWSSGTAPHLTDREQVGKGVHITRWPLGLDASMCPAHAEPRNVTIPLKSWAATAPGLEVEPEGAENAPATTGAREAASHVEIEQMAQEKPKMEVKTTMNENETETTSQVETVDVEAIAQKAAEVAAAKAAEAAVKAYQEQTAKNAPPVNRAGHLTVTDDEADRALRGNPYKSMGEFLQDVARVSTPGYIGEAPQRLLPLQSEGNDLKGFYHLGKAVPNYVGNPSDAHVRRAALKGLKQTGMGESIPARGGFLVGTDRAASLMARVYNVGQILSRVDMVGISANSNSMTFYAEAETSRATGSRRGGIRAYWAAEAAEKTASYPEFREMCLRLYKCIGLVYATDELLADAAALENWIMNNLPEEIAFTVEDAIIRGTGAGQPLGVLTSGCLVTVGAEVGQATATIVAENVSNMWARRWAGLGSNYVWTINQDCEPELDNLQYPAGTGGQLVYMPPGGLADAPYGRIKGRTVLTTEYNPTLGTTGDIMLADFSQYQMIDKGGTEAASSIHVRFIYDETCFRFVYRVDGQPKWNAPLTPYQGTNTVSPFVVIATRP